MEGIVRSAGLQRRINALYPSALVCGRPSADGTKWERFEFVSRDACQKAVDALLNVHSANVIYLLSFLTGDAKGRVYKDFALYFFARCDKARSDVLGLGEGAADWCRVRWKHGARLPPSTDGKVLLYVPVAENNPFWDGLVVFPQFR